MKIYIIYNYLGKVGYTIFFAFAFVWLKIEMSDLLWTKSDKWPKVKILSSNPVHVVCVRVCLLVCVCVCVYVCDVRWFVCVCRRILCMCV